MAEHASIDVAELDAAYARIMETLIQTGHAPHFAELASTLGVTPDRSRTLVHELCAVTPGWMHPGTDWLASFPPFNVQPTQYRIRIDNKHGWFGQ